MASKVSGQSMSSQRIVAAIDFGTAYSGWAFSSNHEYEADPTKVQAKIWIGGQLVSLKGPTCILLKKVGAKIEVDSFGYDAESEYADLVESGDYADYFFYKRFKMMLFNKIGMKGDIMLEDAVGKKLSALTVFSEFIRVLKGDLMERVHAAIDVQWVMTVPAVLDDVAKQFIRQAAEAVSMK